MEELSRAAAAYFESVDRELEQAWLRHPEVPDDVRVQLAIAVAEVVGNIVKHGGALQRPLDIQMQMSLSEQGQVQICFTDDGDAFPAGAELSTRTMPDESAEGGRGLALAQAVLDQLLYRRTNAINYWILLSRRFNPFHMSAPGDSA